MDKLVMLEAVMRHIHNWFPSANGAHYGTYTIQGGNIVLPFVKESQYYRVQGSTFNDGLQRKNYESLYDETFTGTITALSIPQAFISLVDRIHEWCEKNADKAGPYQSESFGGYSYTVATNASGNAVTWKDAFRAELNTWRKI